MQRRSRRFGWWALGVLGAGTVLAATAAWADAGQKGAGWDRSPVLLVGASRSTFDVGGDDVADPQPFWSPRLGLSSTAPRHAVWAFEFGLWADNLGGEWKDGDGVVTPAASPEIVPDFTHRLRLLYLGVPLMVRFSLPSGAVTPYLKGGIEPSFLLSARMQTRETATGVLTRGFHDVRNDCSKFQLSAVAGAGLRTDLAKHAFILEGYYLYGLHEVMEGQSVRPRGALKNRSVQLYLGVGLRRERAAK